MRSAMPGPRRTAALAGAVLAVAGVVAAAPALAQGFPAKPVRVVIGAPPGGGTDILGRTIAPKLAEAIGQQVVIDNRPGAATNIGAELVAKAPPDGHTLLMASTPHVINASLFPSLPFDPVKDFTPIMLMATVQTVLIVHPAVPANSVKELVALARAQPGKLTFGASNGTSQYLAVELFKVMAGVKIENVPYKGAALALNDVLGGHIDGQVNTVISVLPFIKAGKLKALGMAGPKRATALPDVPTIGETLPGFESAGWYGLFGPAGVARDTVAKIHSAFVAALGLPETRDRLAAQGVDVVANAPDEFARFVRDQIPKWAKVVKASGAKAQ